MVNYLLLRDQIGKPRSIPRDLPLLDGQTYGKQLKKDEFNAKELLSGWNQHKSSPRQEVKIRDFRSMNKRALQ